MGENNTPECGFDGGDCCDKMEGYTNYCNACECLEYPEYTTEEPIVDGANCAAPQCLEMPFVMMKTIPKSVDLMVEIVVTTKDKDGTIIVLIVNVSGRAMENKHLYMNKNP